ncbi:DnaJ sub C member 12 [Coemansia sp. RSA 1972]|nr:DnaJ sub C member 12 [Coemansia sp. RSA 1972]
MCPSTADIESALTADYYDVLGCNQYSSIDQIQTEYRTRARHVHPDKRTKMDNEWDCVREAYEVLSDPATRAQYDRWRAAKLPISFAQWKQNPHAHTMHWSFDSQRFIDSPDTHANIMPLTLGQMASDLATNGHSTNGPEPSESNGDTVLLVPHSTDTNSAPDNVVDPVERLVESVRKIRAMTDTVMGARDRIDEMLDNARDLQVSISL